MTIDPRATLWNQFILAAAIARMARPVAEKAGDDLVSKASRGKQLLCTKARGITRRISKVELRHGARAPKYRLVSVHNQAASRRRYPGDCTGVPSVHRQRIVRRMHH